MPHRLDGQPFSASTIPTADEVKAIITDVAEEVATHVGAPIPQEFEDTARYATAIGVAAEIERSFWPEQQDAADATYARFIRRYRELLELLTRRVSGSMAGSVTVVKRDPVTVPDVEVFPWR